MNDMPDNLQKFLDEFFSLTREEIRLYQEAMTHSSNNSLPNNQRLAFLGDSVLRLIIREHFYNKYSDWDKGRLTDLCKGIESDENLAKIAIKHKLVNYMDIMNRPHDYETNETLNAEVLEALFGAVYLNRGFDEVKRIAEKYVLDILEFEIR